MLQVFDPADEIAEQFVANTHLYTLNIPLAAIGIEAATIRDMGERTLRPHRRSRRSCCARPSGCWSSAATSWAPRRA